MTNEDFGELVVAQIEWIEREVEESLEEELCSRGATKKQAREFSCLVRRLENDKSELSGSPDRNVAERFTENIEEFETLLRSLVGEAAFEEMDIYF